MLVPLLVIAGASLCSAAARWPALVAATPPLAASPPGFGQGRDAALPDGLEQVLGKTMSALYLRTHSDGGRAALAWEIYQATEDAVEADPDLRTLPSDKKAQVRVILTLLDLAHLEERIVKDLQSRNPTSTDPAFAELAMARARTSIFRNESELLRNQGRLPRLNKVPRGARVLGPLRGIPAAPAPAATAAATLQVPLSAEEEAARVAAWQEAARFRDAETRRLLQTDATRQPLVAYLTQVPQAAKAFNLPAGFPRNFDGAAAIRWYDALPSGLPGSASVPPQEAQARNTVFTMLVAASFIELPQSDARRRSPGDDQNAESARRLATARKLIAATLGDAPAQALSLDRPQESLAILAGTLEASRRTRTWPTLGSVYLHYADLMSGQFGSASRRVVEAATGAPVPTWDREDVRQRGTRLLEAFQTIASTAERLARDPSEANLNRLRPLLDNRSDEETVQRSLGSNGLSAFKQARSANAARRADELRALAVLVEMTGGFGLMMSW